MKRRGQHIKPKHSWLTRKIQSLKNKLLISYSHTVICIPSDKSSSQSQLVTEHLWFSNNLSTAISYYHIDDAYRFIGLYIIIYTLSVIRSESLIIIISLVEYFRRGICIFSVCVCSWLLIQNIPPKTLQLLEVKHTPWISMLIYLHFDSLHLFDIVFIAAYQYCQRISNIRSSIN